MPLASRAEILGKEVVGEKAGAVRNASCLQDSGLVQASRRRVPHSMSCLGTLVSRSTRVAASACWDVVLLLSVRMCPGPRDPPGAGLPESEQHPAWAWEAAVSVRAARGVQCWGVGPGHCSLGESSPSVTRGLLSSHRSGSVTSQDRRSFPFFLFLQGLIFSSF